MNGGGSFGCIVSSDDVVYLRLILQGRWAILSPASGMILHSQIISIPFEGEERAGARS